MLYGSKRSEPQNNDHRLITIYVKTHLSILSGEILLSPQQPRKSLPINKYKNIVIKVCNIQIQIVKNLLKLVGIDSLLSSPSYTYVHCFSIIGPNI